MTPAFIGALADDLPSCRYLKLEDDPTVQKVTAILNGQPGRGGLRRPGRQLHVRGAAAWRRGHDDRASASRRSSSRSTGTSGPAARSGRATTFYRYLPLIRYENQPGLNLPLRKLIYTIRGAMDHAEPRRPYPALDDVTLLELDALLAHLGLTTPGPVVID